MRTKILSPLRRDGYKAGMIMMLIALSTMMLTTACSSEDDALNNTANTENTINKGYALPVTVNVTREGDATTRASYNESTGKLEFSGGDKLFVRGNYDHWTKMFAGTLDYDAESGKFKGTIYTQDDTYKTYEDLFGNSDDVTATLLPAGYEDHGYLVINTQGTEEKYDDLLVIRNEYTLATSKADGVAQFSNEQSSSYSNGFALSPDNAILNFTITGLAASTSVNVSLTSLAYNITGTVTTDASGNATFAAGIMDGLNLQPFSLTVGGKNITIVSSDKVVEEGKIYNITRSALTYPIALSAVTSDYVGSVVTTDGNVYATVAAASAASKTAVAVIAYVGTAGSVDASSGTYKGLAVALSDANSGSNCKWAEDFANCLSSSQTSDIVAALGFKNGITCTSTLTGDGHTHAAATAAASNNGTAAPTGTSGWFMPSMGQWNLIVQGLATKKAGSAVTTDLTYQTDNPTYKADNLNSVITAAGGTGFKTNSYWASTEQTLVRAWAIYFTNGYATNYAKSVNYYVRSIIAF